MAHTPRTTRLARPAMTIPLPPKFDVNVPVEDEFLTPPIWVASNPPPVFERTEMKRTMSEVSSWGGDDEEEDLSPSSQQGEKEHVEEQNITEISKENLQRPIRLQERRAQTFSNSKPRPPVRPPNKRRISDSVATRTRARLLAQQAFSSTITSASEPTSPEREPLFVTGERKPIITASALTILTLARSSSNPYSPPVDHEKFATAGLPLASPFHEKKSFFDSVAAFPDDPIKKYFSVTKGSKKEKEGTC